MQSSWPLAPTDQLRTLLTVCLYVSSLRSHPSAELTYRVSGQHRTCLQLSLLSQKVCIRPKLSSIFTLMRIRDLLMRICDLHEFCHKIKLQLYNHQELLCPSPHREATPRQSWWASAACWDCVSYSQAQSRTASIAASSTGPSSTASQTLSVWKQSLTMQRLGNRTAG